MSQKHQWSFLFFSLFQNGLSTLQPTPPKKPPRRNLSISPTHLQTQLSLSNECHNVGPSNYEYLFMARSGPTRPVPIDLEEIQKRREKLRHVTRSVDQYVDMKSNLKSDSGSNGRLDEDTESDRPTNKINGKLSTNSLNRRANNSSKTRRTNNNVSHTPDANRAYENHDLDSPGSGIHQRHHHNHQTPCNELDPGSVQDRTYVSSAFLTLKSSQESLLEDDNEGSQKLIPTSPTHYPQPPTPDHPPPTASQAEKSIHERMRPLSQVRLLEKRYSHWSHCVLFVFSRAVVCFFFWRRLSGLKMQKNWIFQFFECFFIFWKV